ncbi:hypothetical protein [Paenibacillus polysaccharolyticus]|nr:hypothetical protein [Paenibacillus polysaccharolyticus]
MHNKLLSMAGKYLEADAKNEEARGKTLFGAAKLPESLKVKKEK